MWDEPTFFDLAPITHKEGVGIGDPNDLRISTTQTENLWRSKHVPHIVCVCYSHTVDGFRISARKPPGMYKTIVK